MWIDEVWTKGFATIPDVIEVPCLASVLAKFARAAGRPSRPGVREALSLDSVAGMANGSNHRIGACGQPSTT